MSNPIVRYAENYLKEEVTKAQVDYEPISVYPMRGLSNRQDFFELLRRIERNQPDAPRLGSSNDQSVNRLSIVQSADFSFAPREVANITLRDQKVQIETRHFGLFAPYGPLPIYVTEHARNEAILNRNKAFEQFVSILSQRFAVLHYRAWSQLNVVIGQEHEDHKNPFLYHLRQIAGTAGSFSIDQHITYLRDTYPGAYLPGRYSLKQLQKILIQYFAIPIRVIPRHAQWIEDGNQSGRQKMARLGQTRVGRRFFDVQHGVFIEIGPLQDPDYLQYQRGSQKLQAIADIFNDFVNYQLVLDVRLLIKTITSMSAKLGLVNMGRDLWLKPSDGIYKQLVYRTEN